MPFKKLDAALPLLIAGAITLLAIVCNFSQMRAETTPVPIITTLITIVYVVVWLAIILFSIIRYHSIALFVFGLFWLLSFVMLIFVTMGSLLSKQPTGLMQAAQIIFFAPMYGLYQFVPIEASQGISAAISLCFGIASILCVRRAPNTMSQKEYKRLNKS